VEGSEAEGDGDGMEVATMMRERERWGEETERRKRAETWA